MSVFFYGLKLKDLECNYCKTLVTKNCWLNCTWGERAATTKTLSPSKAINFGYRQEKAVTCESGRRCGDELWQRRRESVAFAVSLSKWDMMPWSECGHYFLTFQGWMNAIRDYDPETCHPALTHSVFATLEGSRLRLDSSRANISRRAMYDEKVPDATFVKSRSFQLAHSRVWWVQLCCCLSEDCLKIVQFCENILMTTVTLWCLKLFLFCLQFFTK